ncbi:SDR family NAD(P)-dependent oxidoreductase [Sinorhizobium sp. BG8]|uniref:SDR family NAD(P)-dependent oxidoreductase n=1 Tax=Sinorhizobium sp. BG8 TaxID=2613773 RepID=UPI001FEF56F7|nr:SDR family NAD(P)-dependent oxidoreductase [Sinorhizobium sp. BG8]
MNSSEHSSAKSDRNRIAWITGASSGIGRALAIRLARDGWTIAASARTGSALEMLVAEMPGNIRAFPLDVGDRGAVHATLSAIEGELGEVTLAVFAAGTYKRETAMTFEAQVIREMVELNIMGTVNCLEAIVRRMTSRRCGHIAVMASVSGYTGLPGAAGYGATKAALINMCQALYPQLKARGVRLSVINPGFVDTPLTRKNDFPMPFLISATQAADHIARRLRGGRFEIVFPWRMKVAMKLLRALPDRVRFAITARMMREGE